MPVSELGYGDGRKRLPPAETCRSPVLRIGSRCTSEMLINQAAKMRYMFGGVLSVPLVVRAPISATSRRAHH
jgi:hypothetical protein